MRCAGSSSSVRLPPHHRVFEGLHIEDVDPEQLSRVRGQVHRRNSPKDITSAR